MATLQNNAKEIRVIRRRNIGSNEKKLSHRWRQRA
jgi:hypothetical protein